MGKLLARFKRVMILLQTGWSILGITLVVLLLAEAGLRLGFALRDRLNATSSPDHRILVEGYGGATWPMEHYREIESLEERWQPYVYFRPKAFHGKTIDIGADGLRATWQPPAVSGERPQKPFKLLMLGGSSLWGFGARDDQTIPSLLARTLHERGRQVELKNLSGLGYVSTQELIGLIRELQEGYRPDVVIFYDGVNDTTSALLSGEAGLTTNEINRRREFNLLQRPARLTTALAGKLVADSGCYRLAQAVRHRLGQPAVIGLSSPLPDETMHRLAGDVAGRFIANVKIVETLARGYGFRPLFFWQPVIFTKPELTALEREEAQRYAWTEPAFRAVYDKIRTSGALQADPAFHDMSGIFAGQTSLVFIDYCHTTESANARIAAQMAEVVIDTSVGVP